MNQWNHKNFEVFESDINGRKNQTWGSCGGDQTNKVKGGYRFNELGFRGDDIKTYELSSMKLLTFGCSHTLGIGVGNKETWPHILAEKINHSHINFGIQGCSNDTKCICCMGLRQLGNTSAVSRWLFQPSNNYWETLIGC